MIFLIAIIMCGASFFSKNSGEVFGIGLIVAIFSYFMVLIENFRSGRSIQTRGGLINRQTSPIAYSFVYITLFFAGIVAILVSLTALVLT
jgi:hypothetical protein